jgi:hypothetical protein
VNACEPGDAAADAAPDDSSSRSLYLGHQRAAEGVVLSFRELLSQRRADRRRLQPHAQGPHLRFPLVQLVFGADLERGAAAVPRRDPAFSGENSRAAGSSITSGNTARPIATGNPTTMACCSTATRRCAGTADGSAS